MIFYLAIMVRILRRFPLDTNIIKWLSKCEGSLLKGKEKKIIIRCQMMQRNYRQGTIKKKNKVKKKLNRGKECIWNEGRCK